MVDTSTQLQIRFESMYEELSQTVFRYVYLRTRDREVSVDLMQTVFVKVFQSIHKIREGEEAPYVITVAKNTLIDFFRTKKNNVEYDDDVHCTPDILNTDQNPVFEEFVLKENIVFIEKALSMLSETDAEIVRMRALLDWSYQEISVYLKKEESAVRKRYSRAMEKLKEIIEKMYASK